MALQYGIRSTHGVDMAPRFSGAIRAEPSALAYLVVIIFEHEQDARRVVDVLPKRLSKYGLMLHPEKTRLIDFQRRVGRRNADRASVQAPSVGGS
jgi:RNA-directed DNA polymerase